MLGPRKKAESGPLTVDRCSDIFNQKYGNNTIVKGTKLLQKTPRIQTGVFAMTYATGGGYPLWRVSRLRGPQHGGKTTSALEACKMVQRTCFRCLRMVEYCNCEKGPKQMVAVYCDVEGTLDRDWCEAIGIDMDKFYVPSAGDGGEYLDITDLMLQTDDCGIVVIDSIAMLVPPLEMDRAIGDRQVGSLPKLITDATAKLTLRLILERKRNHPCLILCTNQVRMDIGGARYANPESEAGGRAFSHWYALGIRINKLASKEDNNKIKEPDESFDILQRHSFRIDKEKVWTIEKEGEFVRARADAFHKKDKTLLCRKGDTHDHKLITDYGRKHGVIVPSGSQYIIPGLHEEPTNITDLIDLIRVNESLSYQLQKEIVDAAWRDRDLRKEEVNAEEEYDGEVEFP